MHNLTERQILLLKSALSFTVANVDDLIDAHWDELTQTYDSAFQHLNIADDNRDQLAEELRSLLTILQTEADIAPSDDSNLNQNGSTAGDLLKFAGCWTGDDLDQCLQFAIDNRSEAEF